MRQARTETDAGPSAIAASGVRPAAAAVISRILTIPFGLCAALFFVLAVIGTVRNYTPVPWWDMWEDYIGFYLRAHAGDWSAWWVPHNEHRIVLARLFFWIDIKYFHGVGVFSLAIIYAFALAVGSVFAKIWREQSTGGDLYVLFFLEAWIFCWMQRENFTWAFQSQFVLAQLLPLAALYFLHLSASRPARTKTYFAAATICGILAVGSMANGVLALPAMAVYAVMTRNLRRGILFAALSVLEIHFYFQNFDTGTPSFAGEISNQPGHFLEFFLRYIGGPFIALLGFSNAAILIGELAGVAFVLIAAVALYANLRQAERPTLPLALLMFIFYIIATAVITTAGRLSLGMHAALASRYQTPALYGWAATLLLVWPRIAKSNRPRRIFSLLLAASLFFVMLPRQLQALAANREMQYQRVFSALALELQIDDADRILELYPWPRLGLGIALAARRQHLSIFGIPPIADAHLLLGQKIDPAPFDRCHGHLDLLQTIPDAPQYVRVTGWFYDGHRVTTPQRIVLIDETNKIAGIGLLGESRVDVAHIYGRKALYSGFQAYLFAREHGQPISISGPGNDCRTPLMIAPMAASPARRGN